MLFPIYQFTFLPFFLFFYSFAYIHFFLEPSPVIPSLITCLLFFPLIPFWSFVFSFLSYCSVSHSFIGPLLRFPFLCRHSFLTLSLTSFFSSLHFFFSLAILCPRPFPLSLTCCSFPPSLSQDFLFISLPSPLFASFPTLYTFLQLTFLSFRLFLSLSFSSFQTPSSYFVHVPFIFTFFSSLYPLTSFFSTASFVFHLSRLLISLHAAKLKHIHVFWQPLRKMPCPADQKPGWFTNKPSTQVASTLKKTVRMCLPAPSQAPSQSILVPGEKKKRRKTRTREQQD